MSDHSSSLPRQRGGLNHYSHSNFSGRPVSFNSLRKVDRRSSFRTSKKDKLSGFRPQSKLIGNSKQLDSLERVEEFQKTADVDTMSHEDHLDNLVSLFQKQDETAIHSY